MQAFDAAAFAAHVRHEWDAVAEDWGRDDWRDFVEAAAGGVSERLLEMAAVASGHRVLDLGTGVGEPAASAARRVGPSGRVLGLDLSPRMVELGNRRLERHGLRHAELRVGDAGDPGVPAASYDAVLSRWVLMLVPDLPAALRRIHDVLVPGGRLAVGLWGHPERVPMISAALAVAAEMMDGAPPMPPGAPGHLWEHGAEAFAGLMTAAGFTDVRHEAVDVVFELDGGEAYAGFITAMAGPLRVVSDALPPPGRRELARRLAAAAEPWNRGGRVRLVNETLCVAGRRPRFGAAGH
jgi:ubiquinone/menaquinone biosynthesis C-methylase UbiE